MKIDWSKAPEWAKYCAVDLEGQAYWHAEKPKLENGEWISGGQWFFAPDAVTLTTLSERSMKPQKLAAPMNTSTDLNTYTLTKPQKALLTEVREMVKWRQSRTPLQIVTLKKTDWKTSTLALSSNPTVV
jgi:hypothetical protein